MSRLADYFAIIGYDHEKDRSGSSCGKVIQRFPEKDWDDCPFTQGIELFCQPTGWTLSTQRQQPSFYVAVLTDIDADRHYCASFTFYETIAMTPTHPDDQDGDDQEPNMVHHSLMFAPKSLVLMSRLDYFEAFRNCLGLIYTVYTENLQVQMETIVGNILGCVQVPPPGGPQVRFSIGAGDRQALQPPLSSTLPVTKYNVALVFDQLGINNAMTVFTAALTDHKILFHSFSYSRLTATAHAFVSLMYPLKYSYVYIPILPASLLEVLNTPTPFIAGVHASLRNDVVDLLDVIIVDLDGGSVRIPECVSIPSIPDPILNRTMKALTRIQNTELLSADYAFPPSPRKPSPATQRDKEIRAVFIRMFADIFTGYRSCLTIIRIHPEPFITFHKASFLGQRGMVDDDFILRVLDGMGFGAFVAERGPPYRVCDIFDEVYATMQDHLREERLNPDKMMEHVKDLAHQLHLHENPNPQPYVQKVPKPTEGAYARIHQPPFQMLNANTVQDIIDEGLAKHSIKSKLANVRPHQCRIVPMGMPITALADKQRMVENNARRLEVLRNCVNFIFENKISDARIIFPAVLRALKSRVARLALTQELNYHVQSNRAMLENQQFDLVVKLLNCALQNDSNLDESGVAAAMVPLVTAFCRKLCTGVLQFAYTCVQDHAVWANLQFWEQAFYQDVQKQIRQLYLPQYEEHLVVNVSREGSRSPSTPRETGDSISSWSRSSSTTSDSRRSGSAYKTREIGALEIAAEQLRIYTTLNKMTQQELINNEESTVYSQAIHYANRMVFLRVPLDVSRSLKNTQGLDGESNSNSNITASIAESDSFDAESGFDETETVDVGSTVVRFVTRFVDKVCSEGGVTQEHIKSLHQMIPGVVAMHIETLENVHKESKRLPPIQKPKILTPSLLPGEEVVMEGLRVYLLPDGREEGLGAYMGGPTLLPAEGAVFLTTYRIIFKGTPCDPLSCEQIVIRSFPVATLTKEKKISVQYLPHLDQWLQEGLQLRSNVFQLLKVAFDEEVGSDNVETFRKLVIKIRNPPSVFNTFAFTGHLIQQATPLRKQKEKNASLRQFAKRTLLKTARKAGLKSKQSNRKTKYVLPTPPMQRRNISPRSSDSESERPNSEAFDDLSIIDEGEFTTSLSSDPKNLERLVEKTGYQDYQRLGLGNLSTIGQKSRSEPFRISVVNANYSVCRSYPALLVVPQVVADESIRKFARCHRQSRFPVITWRHPRTKALLLRASGLHSRGLMGMLRHNQTSGTSSGETSSSLEQEKYFSALVAATPSSNRSYHSSYSDSLTSLDSLMMVGTDTLTIPETPDPLRRSIFSKGSTANRGSTSGKPKPTLEDEFDSAQDQPMRVARRGSFVQTMNRLRASIGKGGIGFGSSSTSLNRIGSLREKSRYSSPDTRSRAQNGSLDHRGDLINSSVQGLHRVSLYVLGEKTQMKGIKMESFQKCDFIPVDFFEVRHVKASFKKLMRACVPSSLSPEANFYKAVEESEWLLQIQNVLQLAGATVDLLDVQGSSVMICLEDGWDVTSQVVAVAEILLDPYYRTIEGFKALVEKEWLSFGHRFTHRSNQTAANQASGFAPVFLQFLDTVHQIHRQFPLSFEFNQHLLKVVAYHYVSNRFRTFMLDNEFERVEAGWLHEDKRPSKLDDGEEDPLGGFSPKHTTNTSVGGSIWDYIEKQHRRSAMFYNFMYSPEDGDTVLRPYSNISNLRIWDYYLAEDLAHGPTFDMEVVSKEIRQNEDQEAEAMGISRRKILNACYDSVMLQEPNYFHGQFQEIHRLETDLGHLPQKWKVQWDKLESPHRDHVQRQVSFNTQMVRSHGRSIHKRSTLEILVRGKMLGEAARMFTQPHHFEKTTFTTPMYCDYCTHVLWGLSKTGMRCVDCGYNCHDKCQPSVPKNCTKLKTMSDASASSSSISRTGGSDASSSSVDTLSSATTQAFENFPSSLGDCSHSTHEGFLYKQGALLKGWKQRWFVLDSMKHQLRYYDAIQDGNCKGFIDLAEVESVQPVKNHPGASKKSEENSIFEIRTVRRQYNFMAANPVMAQEWIDKLQSCIQ
ncbi:myotubularin-related protein 13-like isoform X3 [Haliotis rufescens]|uniref:myotubularin-related protein 13-like isoform X3 n=1 Tax=Haliotis rufescens TaxID=6454 RepID=UPI00201F67DA|nr:myotubularin-related protein 13-like isoform X3 [Haliotis rufescens]